jgi:hypothetical protein
MYPFEWMITSLAMLIQSKFNKFIERNEMKKTKMGLFFGMCLLMLSIPALSSAQEKNLNIDPTADRILREMSDYMNTFEQFKVQVDNTVDILLSSGQKVQMGRSGIISVRRPDRMHISIDGDQVDQEFFYDGKSVTLLTKHLNYYATIEAPPTIEEALDNAEESVGLVAPFSDLISRNSYHILTEDITSSLYVGLSKISGVECHHLAFRAEETDWEIWIENSRTPFPMKFIVTNKWVKGGPQFTGLLTKWDLSPQLSDGLFTFVAQQDAEKIEFLPAGN